MTAILVILVTSASLVLGAWIGVRGWLSKRVEGLLVAGAGGALIVSVMMELIEPSLETLSLATTAGAVLLGAVGFSLADAWTDRHMAGGGGLGLLLAVTFDGIPENLALGTALIGAGPLSVAALAGSILLSNLPEAAGGARSMGKDGWSKGAILGLWAGVAGLVSGAAVLGLTALAGLDPEAISAIKCVAAGAILASLATEVFPEGGNRDPHAAGVAVAVGLLAALALQQLSP